MRHTGRYWWFEVICGVGLVVADVGLSLWGDGTPEWVLYITLIPNVRASNHSLTRVLVDGWDNA